MSAVYPETKCMDMDEEEWDRLVKKIPEIIVWGIDTNEMTPEEYREGMGKEYRNKSIKYLIRHMNSQDGGRIILIKS